VGALLEFSEAGVEDIDKRASYLSLALVEAEGYLGELRLN